MPSSQHIEPIQHTIRYQHWIMEVFGGFRDRAAAEAHLASTTAMTATQVARVMNVSFGEVTRDRREVLDMGDTSSGARCGYRGRDEGGAASPSYLPD